MRILKYRINPLALTAYRNRQELIKAGLGRRDFLKMGLLTAGGYLIAKHGLSSRVFAQGGADDGAAPPAPPPSPPTTAFSEPMPIPPVKQPLSSLTPTPQASPNSAAGEARTRAHQAFAQFPPQKLYTRVAQAAQISLSKDLPLQPMWTFDGTFPGPTYVAKYGEPILVRTSNQLPSNNGGFGKNETSVHTHNGHTPSESDGFPCDFFGNTFNNQAAFYDQHYPNVLAGFSSTHQPNGDINEALSTLWYHDHRVDFTAQNVYKGMAGFFLLFNQFDTGDETTGFRLPSGQFDVPIMLTDKRFDPATGLLAFDLMNTDGILGDKFLANGKIQPFFQVHPRRYRLRLLSGGPSRFYQLFLTDTNNLSATNNFFQIANDGNLLPKPISVSSVRLGVAERCDIIVDFSKFAGKSIYLENRLQQIDGRKPGDVLGAGQGNMIIRFDVNLPSVADNSQDPATITKFYSLPSTTATPRVTRTFQFVRVNGQWMINGQLMDCNTTRFTVQKNSVEKWVLVNNSGGWQHPIHIHFEEHQILSRNGVAPAAGSAERSRKDVTRLQFNERVELFFRFRDFKGIYPLHCHNLVHEDDAMMLKWQIDDTGDTNANP